MNQHSFESMREAMIVSQLRPVAVNDPRVVAAFRAIPREDYVPEARAALAYADASVPLGNGRALNVPLATARLIGAADVGANDTVLLIGAATGYAAAVLAQLAANVVAVEESPALAAAAKKAMKAYSNVTLVMGALNVGAKKQGRYDAILIDGAVDAVPDALLAQLKVGGRLATGLNDKGVTRLALGHKSVGGFGLVPFLDAECVALPGFARPKAFQF